jgi:hypothetical protein
MAAFYRVVDNHRLYNVLLSTVVMVNGNIILVYPLSLPLFGPNASVQSDRPHESAITIQLRNYICLCKII